MFPMHVIKLIGEIGGILGALMVATNTSISGYGFILFLISSVSWTIVAAMMREWSLMRMSIAFSCINVLGIVRWFI